MDEFHGHFNSWTNLRGRIQDFNGRTNVMSRVPLLCAEPLILLVLAALSGETLRLSKVSIPGYKLRGEMAILECDYELDGETLYAVKWYKDNEEFYRYVPKLDPPQHSYKVDGIKVDHQLSDRKRVALRGVNLKSSGIYRCEVSAEAPSFSSAQEEGRMDVVYLPKDGPHITGKEKEYLVGDEILLNCTSGKSYPASILHWFLNDKQIPNGEDLIEYPNVVHGHGLVTSNLGLRLHATTNHFQGGQIRLKCVASVSPVLWRGNRESVVQRVTPLVDNREAHFLVKGSACKLGPGLLLSFFLVLAPDLFLTTFFLL